MNLVYFRIHLFIKHTFIQPLLGSKHCSGYRQKDMEAALLKPAVQGQKQRNNTLRKQYIIEMDIMKQMKK